MKVSRGTEVDMQKCQREVGDNHYHLILIASHLCRQARKDQLISGDTSKEFVTPVTTLLEIQNGRLGQKYVDPTFKRSK
jgi:hypothetical protein